MTRVQFKEAVASAMTERGLTRAALARIAGLPETTVRNWYSPSKAVKPTLDAIECIATVLELEYAPHLGWYPGGSASARICYETGRT